MNSVKSSVSTLPKEPSSKMIEELINEKVEKILQIKTPEQKETSKVYSMHNSRNKQTVKG